MDSDFVTTLLKVKDSKDYYPDAPAYLDESYYDIQKELKGRVPTLENQFRKFAEHTFNQIIVEKPRIEKYLEDYFCKINSNREKISVYEIEIIQEEIDYYTEILTTIDEAISYLLRYLIAFFPEYYRKLYYVKLLKTNFRFRDEVIDSFLTSYGYQKKGQFNSAGDKKSYIHVALLYWYSDRVISNSDKGLCYSGEIAKTHRLKSKEKLYNTYGSCNNKEYRTAVESKRLGTQLKRLKLLKDEILPALLNCPKGKITCSQDIDYLEKWIKKEWFL